MRRNERNTMTVDQENRIIRQCNHVKKYRSNGRICGYRMQKCKHDKRNAGEQQKEVFGVHDNNEKKRITADRDLRRACMDYEKINEYDRHIQSARRQMEQRPYQADFRNHIMSRFERVE